MAHSFFKQGYRLRAHRCRTPFAEVDLVMQKEGQVLLIEVKRAQGFSHLSQRQRARLLRALNHYMREVGEVRVHLALVNSEANVEVIEDVLAV